MLENGGFIGILIGGAFCAILYLLVKREGKKAEKSINKIVEQLPAEDKEKLRMSQLHDYSENANFLVGFSIIYDMADSSKDVEINLVFYDNYNSMFRIESVHMSKEEQLQRNLMVGQMVETLHNRRSEVWLKVNKIL